MQKEETTLNQDTQSQPLFTDAFLLAEWANEYEAYTNSADSQVFQHLKDWANRDKRQTETQLQGSFVETILCRLLGFWTTGGTAAYFDRTIGEWQPPAQSYTAHPEFAVPNAGQSGGSGSADIALGLFGHVDNALIARSGISWTGVPQVLGEFKDIRSGLDVPQNRKDNDRSPVGQCFDYLKHAFDQTPTNVALKPSWGLVTDMVEFRLYSRTHGQARYQRFVIDESDLLAETERGRRRRFFFRKVLSPSQLLSHRAFSPLAKLLDGQLTQQKTLEKTFYLEYKAYRERVYDAIVECNPKFSGSRGDLVTLTQRFLDRCIFVLFCEDMGRNVGFPPRLLQEMLAEQSVQSSYSPSLKTIWPLVSALFTTMREGGDFPPDHQIQKFNGGLFVEDTRLDNLVIPNYVFCAKGQGVNAESIARDKATLLYLAATYNFGEGNDADSKGELESNRTITLYTLGRIFEQSITELEYLHAHAENRDTPAKLAKRKRDGVYYTPEWITNYIVQETVGRRLRDEQERLGLELGANFPDEQIRRYRKGIRAQSGKTSVAEVTEHLKRLGEYRSFVDHLTILDPACGSGAFLITALLYLRQHYRDLIEEEQRISGVLGLFDQDAIVRGILANNLYGVDLNPESVEITQLALWLHTATKGQPLTTLDKHIRCGNSLVGPDFAAFYKSKHQTLFDDLSRDEQELVNVFDWIAAFPEILGENAPAQKRGFDCIVGNPPYVSNQHLRVLDGKIDEYAYLREQVKPGSNGLPLYRSTRTGNFDLYLPFIEQGIRLLNQFGRMGYIAPSVWLKNEYGIGLKRLLVEQGGLDRWVDFGHFQVFDDVTVYTALQFFSRIKNAEFPFFLGASQNVVELDWNVPHGRFSIGTVSSDEAWQLQYDCVRTLIDSLKFRCKSSIGQLSSAICVGVQTSGNHIYHLLSDETGQLFSDDDNQLVSIEESITRTLCRGPDVDRYTVPKTTYRIIVPYNLGKSDTPVFSRDELQDNFPKAFKYFQRYEDWLRENRGDGRGDDIAFWRFKYKKNLDKQSLPRVLVSGTCQRLEAVADFDGALVQDDRRVFAIVPKPGVELGFMLGVINSPIADFVFRYTARPKDNGFFDVDKQFIAPIPVPTADRKNQQSIGEKAKLLQELHTKRRDDIAAFEKRVASPQCLPDGKALDWLWANTKLENIKQLAPAGLNRREVTAWITQFQRKRLDEYYERIDAVLVPNSQLSVVVESGDLFLRFGNLELLAKYAPDQDATYIAALWRHKLRTNRITAGMNAKKLIGLLLDLRTTSDVGLQQSLIKRDADLIKLESQIVSAEAAINSEIFDLYGLTEEERNLIVQSESHQVLRDNV